MWLRLISCLCLLSVLGGCTYVENLTSEFVGVDNTEPPTPLAAFPQRLRVIEVWSKAVGEGLDEQYLKLTPALYDNNLFIADSEGALSALDATNGRSLWRAATDHPITGGPGAGSDLILVGTREGEILAYSADIGKFLWKSRVSSEVLAAPQARDNIVVVRTIDGKLFGLSGETGDRLWTYDRSVPALTLRGTSAPIIDSGLVITGFDGGKLTALELGSGRLLWETAITQASGRSELDRMVDIDSEPVIVDGVIYVATFQGNIAAVELETGRMLWNREISSHAGLGVDRRHVYVTDDDSYVWALDRTSGSSVWKQEQLRARAATAPAGIGNYVVVGDLEGYLHWLDSDSGEFIARHRFTESRIIAPPVVSQDILYTYSSSGTLGAFTYQ
ncbi:MAG: outer membrane protein assembly factor BamB [Thiotrichales bacterium]|nr:outer membrane protein assembly factor BamB [Thiotrichales bacterium]